MAKEAAEDCCCGSTGVRQHVWSRALCMPPKLHTWAQKKENWDSQSNAELQMMKTWWSCRVNDHTKSLDKQGGWDKQGFGGLNR